MTRKLTSSDCFGYFPSHETIYRFTIELYDGDIILPASLRVSEKRLVDFTDLCNPLTEIAQEQFTELFSGGYGFKFAANARHDTIEYDRRISTFSKIGLVNEPTAKWCTPIVVNFELDADAVLFKLRFGDFQ